MRASQSSSGTTRAEQTRESKKIYQFSVAGLQPQLHGAVFPVVKKTFVRDLIPDLTKDNGPVLEKVEGFTMLSSGDALIVTDNDGVSNSSGETQFIRLNGVFEKFEGQTEKATPFAGMTLPDATRPNAKPPSNPVIAS